MELRNYFTLNYALILQYLSDESLEAVKRQDNWDVIKRTTDAKGLWRLIQETHKVNSISQVASITKLTARSTYQQIHQGAYESIITYKERFTNALKAYEEQGNVKLSDEDIAMDFFRGLDNGRYSIFKTEIMILLTTNTLEQPKDLNSMYLLASQWLKPNTRSSSSTQENLSQYIYLTMILFSIEEENTI